MAAVNVRLILRLLVPMAFALTIMTLIRCIEFVTKFPKQFQYRTFFIFNRSNIPQNQGACVLPMAVINKKSHSDGELSCKVPTLDPFLPVIMKSLQPREPIKCNGRLYTEYENNVLRLLDDISEGHQVDEVYAEPFIRVSDFNVTLGEKRFLELTKKEVKVPINSDFLKVTVRFKDGSEQTDFHASISEIPDVAQRKETHDAPLNIMVLGLDRTSSAHFQRMTPKTYAFLKDQLDSIIFKSYSIVGENTAPALSAFLTGKSLKENCAFKEARKGFKNAGRVDDWPFIFSDLKTLGIPTMWSEDQPSLGAFHFQLKGFNKQPTDHYGRSLWWLYDGNLCKHSLPQYKLQLQYLKSFIKSYPGKRKFGFVFLSDLCHRWANLLSAGDDGFLEFFKSLKNESLLNDTLFITMGDHGPYTYGAIRDSPQGKLEHRLPFLSLTFPAWFKRSYPVQMAALIRNSRIISSPFDLHKTMKHLLTFPQKTFVQTDTIGESLFEPLPGGRACEDTGIPEFYCPCLSLRSIDTAHAHVHRAVKVAVKHINDILMSRSIAARLCHQLELKAIFEAYQKMPSRGSPKNVLTDHRNTSCKYQIKFQTTPGDGLFEALLKMNSTGGFEILNYISRINTYGNQSSCIGVPYIKPYCLCR